MIKIETKSIIKVASAIFILFLLISYWSNIASIISGSVSAAMPLIIGCLIAYYLNILMSFYERHFFPKAKKKGIIKLRRPVSIIFAILTLVAILVLVLALIIPQLVSCFELLFDILIKFLPGFVSDLFLEIEKLGILPEDIIGKLSAINWQNELSKIFTTLFSSISGAVNLIVNFVSSFISVLSTLFVAVIFSIYLLSGKSTISTQFKRLFSHFLPEKKYDVLAHVLSVFNDSFRRFIVGQCTEAVILGGLTTIGMLILQLPYAAMIGVLMAVSCFIPLIGEFICGGIGVFLIAVQSPFEALIFLIFLIIVLNLEGNLIFPKVIGSTIGLPSVWLISAVTIGGGLFGIVGVIFSVPIAAAVYRLLKEYIKPLKEEKPENNKETTENNKVKAVP